MQWNDFRIHIVFSATNVVHAWIGATDCATDKWIWASTFAPVTYSNWYSNEPNGKTKENCGEIYPTYNGKWNDSVCENEYVFVCKRHIVSV